MEIRKKSEEVRVFIGIKLSVCTVLIVGVKIRSLKKFEYVLRISEKH